MNSQQVIKTDITLQHSDGIMTEIHFDGLTTLKEQHPDIYLQYEELENAPLYKVTVLYNIPNPDGTYAFESKTFYLDPMIVTDPETEQQMDLTKQHYMDLAPGITKGFFKYQETVENKHGRNPTNYLGAVYLDEKTNIPTLKKEIVGLDKHYGMYLQQKGYETAWIKAEKEKEKSQEVFVQALNLPCNDKYASGTAGKAEILTPDMYDPRMGSPKIKSKHSFGGR